uniref:Metalloendopeptidase n=1 Tax=Anopheles atroparvus TaxID=41427 RepID=A0A182JFH1_ANOAO
MITVHLLPSIAMVYGKVSLFAICTLLLVCSLLEETEGRCTRPSQVVGNRVRGFRERRQSFPKHVRRKPWEMGVGVYHEMDIMLQPARQRNGISLTASPNARWPNAIVPYVISSAFSAAERNTILQGMQQFTANTCVRFVQRTTQTLYITIDNVETGCWSYVGRSATNTYNQVNLQSPDCVDVGTVTHELMHAIGFYHEFTRPDRDTYVSIDRTALAREYQTQSFYDDNYAKMADAEVVLYGRPYDYGSVMHYSKYAAGASNTRPVMNNLQPWTGDFGNDNGLSAADIIDVNYISPGDDEGGHDHHSSPGDDEGGHNDHSSPGDDDGSTVDYHYPQPGHRVRGTTWCACEEGIAGIVGPGPPWVSSIEHKSNQRTVADRQDQIVLA